MKLACNCFCRIIGFGFPVTHEIRYALLTIAAITGTKFLVLAIDVTQPNSDKGLK